MRVEPLQRVEGKDEASDIASALASYADSHVPPPPMPKTFGVRETAIVLAVAAVVTVALDSEGMLTWAQRLEVGPVQTTLLSVLQPLHAGLAKVGLTVPRHVVAEGRERLSQALGGEGDPLLAEGWVSPDLPLPVGGEGRGEGSPVVDAGVGIPNIPEPVVEEVDAGSLTPLEQTGVISEALGEGGGVLVLGDSMIAGVLGATLEQTLARGTGLPVTRAAQLGTGLSRPDVFDWSKVVPPLQRRDRPRFVVVSLGANDATNLREGDDTIEYGDTRWRAVYAVRVEAMMRMLAVDDVRVLWLGLPPMRDTRLQARAAFLNGIFTAVAKRVRGVEVLPVDMLVGDGEGRYATFVTAPDGKLRRYRLDDGVHLAPAGARAVSGWVLDWVKERAR